ncbi:SAM-dependent methyltransferase [Paenibacillus sp. CAA11]|uniref:class I SAM-dependent DNA methyltransferase n=1 Tax=Paenibacillus sp. CAA11 TaxID=1532905 RepID=UPI000D3A6379|nr:class I SAM-dependent methyltransferase [Paenibacillus sp. CAA11]AWB45929.1 SAM-dependent methyltransferase [Paenibacillus sp. CAA11]
MGREFVELFDEWSHNYDLTVLGHDEQYREVFEHYERILNLVVSEAIGTVVEFGVGTGNLTEKLAAAGHTVYGIEPSQGMRDQVLKRGIPFELLDGDFLAFPELPGPVDTITSTYAFHHLTDEEKERAIAHFANLLSDKGKIVFADTVFADPASRRSIEEEVEAKGYFKLLQDLRTEYYTTIAVLNSILTKHGFKARFTRLNKFVWLVVAEREAL